MTMDDDPSDRTTALREGAREWGRSRLAAAPWSELQGPLPLMLVDPPAVRWETPVYPSSPWTFAAARRAVLLARARPAARAAGTGGAWSRDGAGGRKARRSLAVGPELPGAPPREIGKIPARGQRRRS